MLGRPRRRQRGPPRNAGSRRREAPSEALTAAAAPRDRFVVNNLRGNKSRPGSLRQTAAIIAPQGARRDRPRAHLRSGSEREVRDMSTSLRSFGVAGEPGATVRHPKSRASAERLAFLG